ncbi:hypothetical protein H634G_05588 [Metarhizium anisopliae BRIP 53293]|uniref:SMP-30/Gluconolactonase/LRE-like region domain-containing protein n=1 Tax=Metarhizium anisopliae BRIP 53293 TaxID=1291518 RepID=A0A0D9NXK2_METAN|nr:hypothetical protein H634G_05588 [Metarhizium anisopliae BRIP 53293]KJK92512.1 hypothetical protein H633G_03648 [Metarhizium anisopliae BRIP 53284]
MRLLTLVLGASPITALTANQLFQFANTSQFVENIAVRPNGHLLLNTFDNARLYTLDSSAKEIVPQVVAQIPGSTALTGIVDVAHDVYAVSAGILNFTNLSFEPGTSKIVLVNVGDCSHGKPASVEHRHIVLSADSKTGRVYRVNTLNGEVDIALEDDGFTPGPRPNSVPLGINGIKVFNGYLYLTNSGQGFVARIKINDFGDKAGDLEIITTLPLDPPKTPDDFSIAKDGTIYLGAHLDTLVKITPDGKWVSLIEGSSAGVYLDGPTSTALSKDEKTVFVTTGGGGQSGKGGQIVAVKL